MGHKDFLHKLLSGDHFSQEEMTQCMNAIMNGVFPDTVIAALLALLEHKGVTSTEVAGAYYSLIAKANTIDLSPDAVDTCGTGGDHAGTYNISTIGSIIANSTGVSIAKHGNRSVTSSCGSADVLEELGFRIDLPVEATVELYARTGFSFLFAPLFHPSMKRVAHIRKELGIRTIFNMLGPLINPARSKRQLVGVYSSELMELYTEVLLQTGTRHAMIVHAMTEEGVSLDEPSLNGPILLKSRTDMSVGIQSIRRISVSTDIRFRPFREESESRMPLSSEAFSMAALHRRRSMQLSIPRQWPVTYPDMQGASMTASPYQENRLKAAIPTENSGRFLTLTQNFLPVTGKR